MKKRIVRILALCTVSLSLLSSSCEKDKDDDAGLFSLRFSATAGTQPFQMDQTFADEQGRNMRIETFLFYISNVKLIKSNQEEVALTDVALINFGQGTTEVEVVVPHGDYSGIRFGLGLDTALNASDPSTFSSTHPLSSSMGTYWSWASMYKFAMLEGRVDTAGTPGNQDDLLLSYHPGTNPLYRTVALNRNFSVNDAYTYSIAINIYELFNGAGGLIDVTTDNQTHTTPSDFHIAERFIDNFAGAFE